MKKVKTNSSEETLDWAKKYALKLKPGQTISLEGDLGAGKTVITKGIALGLGITAVVNSPTFVLMKVYDVVGPKIKQLVHVDAYRLSGAEELLAIGLQDYLEDKESLVLVEWGNKVKDILPKKHTKISLKVKGENERELTIS